MHDLCTSMHEGGKMHGVPLLRGMDMCVPDSSLSLLSKSWNRFPKRVIEAGGLALHTNPVR